MEANPSAVKTAIDAWSLCDLLGSGSSSPKEC